MILVTVGTARGGFDALVEAADAAAAKLGMEGLAQIGTGAVRPRWLAWRRFLPPRELQEVLSRRPLLITHGGMGLLGEAMRAGCRIIAVPRRGPTTAAHPSNDQTAFLEALAGRHPIVLCRDPSRLTEVLTRLRGDESAAVDYRLGSDIPRIVVDFLTRDMQSSADFTDSSALP